MKFAVFLMLLLCLSTVSAAPYDADSIEANYLHSGSRPMIRVDGVQSKEERRRAEKLNYLEQIEMLSERADPPDERFRAESDAAADAQQTTNASPVDVEGEPAELAESPESVAPAGAEVGTANEVPGDSSKEKVAEEPQAPESGSPVTSSPNVPSANEDSVNEDTGGGGINEEVGTGATEKSWEGEPQVPAEESGVGEGSEQQTGSGSSLEGPAGASEVSPNEPAVKRRPGAAANNEESPGETGAAKTPATQTYLQGAAQRIAALTNALRPQVPPAAVGGAPRQRVWGGRGPPRDPEGTQTADKPGTGHWREPQNHHIRPDPTARDPKVGGSVDPDASGDFANESAGSQLKWTEHTEPQGHGDAQCPEGEDCSGGLDLGVVNAMPVPPPIRTPTGCSSPDHCVYLTQHRKVFGPYLLPGLTDHFKEKARWVDMLIDGRKIRGFLMGPLRTLGEPIRRLFSPGLERK